LFCMKILMFLLVLGLAVAGCRQSPPPAQSASSSSAEAPITIDPATAGSIAGSISFQGTKLKLPAIDMTADPACPAQGQTSDAIVINEGKLANVFVYVKEGLPLGRYAAPSEAVVLDQRGCRYVPHVLGVMAGQPLKILNSDHADHNVHAMPSANPQWNESQMPTDPPIVKSFVKPEMMVAMQCNQHPWMRAYVNVMAHPYYAVSAADGKFAIRNLPPGEYTLVAVHEKFGDQSSKVKVGPRENARADFTFRPGE
jgi:plastocyanin